VRLNQVFFNTIICPNLIVFKFEILDKLEETRTILSKVNIETMHFFITEIMHLITIFTINPKQTFKSDFKCH
jgi:hypothetical protein